MYGVHVLGSGTLLAALVIVESAACISTFVCGDSRSVRICNPSKKIYFIKLALDGMGWVLTCLDIPFVYYILFVRVYKVRYVGGLVVGC